MKINANTEQPAPPSISPLSSPTPSSKSKRIGDLYGSLSGGQARSDPWSQGKTQQLNRNPSSSESIEKRAKSAPRPSAKPPTTPPVSRPSPTNLHQPISPPKSKKVSPAVIGGSIGGVVIALAMIAVLIHCYKKTQKRRNNFSDT